MQKGSSKNPWNKSNLRNRCRAWWAKGKTGIGLDEHCANSYIPQHIYTIIQCAEHAGCRNLHSARLALCPSCPLPTKPCTGFADYSCSMGFWRILFAQSLYNILYSHGSSAGKRRRSRSPITCMLATINAKVFIDAVNVAILVTNFRCSLTGSFYCLVLA